MLKRRNETAFIRVWKPVNESPKTIISVSCGLRWGRDKLNFSIGIYSKKFLNK